MNLQRFLRRRVRRSAELAALLALAASPVPIGAQEPAADPAAELLRARVETLREDGRLNVRGAWLSSRHVLPVLYEANGFRRLWDDARADQLARAIDEARSDGLDPRDYHAAVLEQLERQTSAGEGFTPTVLLGDRDLVLTDAFVRLWSHLRFGKLEARTDSLPPAPRWDLRRLVNGRDPAAVLHEILDAGDVERALLDARPTHALYEGLREALGHCRVLAARGGWPALARGPLLKPGLRDARVPALRRRLALSGDAVPDSGAGEGAVTYDSVLVTAVAALQRRHGLPDDGVVGPLTLAALNVTAEARTEQLRANLERARQFLRDLDTPHVAVNIPDQRAELTSGGRVLWRARAQVGRPLRQTPSFRARLTYLVLNPPWVVPEIILARELIPGMRADPSTLARRRLRLIDRDGAEADPATVDWAAADASCFPYLVQQDPGPDNPLGRVKFMLPNDHQVYLHDTPNRALFASASRAASSGCIRLEDPLGLAEQLLTGQPLPAAQAVEAPVLARLRAGADAAALATWTRAAIDTVIATGETLTVPLTSPLPVLLLYLTAWQDEAGRVQFRADIYGRDAPLLEMLDARFTAAE